MRIAKPFLLFLFSISAVLAAQERPAVETEIPKYLAVSPSLGTGGQPTDKGLQFLKEKGYKTVINLRTANEGVDLAAEAKLARELGLRYINIPVVTSAPKEEQAVEFLKYMEELKGEKTFIHCAAANRVGGFVLIQQVVKEGVSLEKAEQEADRIGLRSEGMRQFAKDFIAKHKPK